MRDPYDALAPHYRDYASRKSSYLKAVDAFIAENLPESRSSLLDVGAGDGVRGMALARDMGAQKVVLADISSEMVALCRSSGADEVWQCAAQELPDTGSRFDVILCLWNVLGHLPDHASRIEALKCMRRALLPAGRLFIDVNNRHNAAAYGRWRVFGRRVIDALYPDRSRGDTSFDWQIGDRKFPAMGHLFSPAEANALIAEAGFRIVKFGVIDYSDGRRSTDPTAGQLVFCLGDIDK